MTKTRKNKNPAKTRMPVTALRCLAMGAVTSLLLAQLVALSHFVFYAHSISPVTGHVVHPSGDSQSHNGRNAPCRGSSDDECQVFTTLFQTKSLSVLPPPALAPLVFFEADPRPQDAAPALAQWAIYLLAPSQSPPVLA